MRVEIVPDRCEGHGLCETTAPAVYRLDEEGMVHARVDPVPPELAAAARAGARVCPMAALRVGGPS
ncbi:ferredoxin [Streptomyces sp. NBC_00457]|uniref:ferredoxin n=1 Tax=Streptomyces sp. NBC_00457 TaxID=2975748 RepID=UPI002E202FDC